MAVLPLNVTGALPEYYGITRIDNMTAEQLQSRDIMMESGNYAFSKNDGRNTISHYYGLTTGTGYSCFYGNAGNKNTLYYLVGFSVDTSFNMLINWSVDAQSALFVGGGTYRKGYYYITGNYSGFTGWVGDIYLNPSTLYSDFDSAIAEMDSLLAIERSITYIPINSTLNGPSSAVSGETVNVSVSFPDGYIYQEQGVSIYNKDGSIPFTYDNGTLTFTMP